MGTRADYYIGNDPATMEWLGSVAYDGYDIHDRGPGSDIDVCAVAYAKTADQFRTAVARFLASRDDATTPDQGWPWPWDNSQTTDYAYCFVGQEVLCYGFGYGPRKIGERFGELCDEEDGENWVGRAAFPDMSARKNVAYGKRSGLNPRLPFPSSS